MKTISLLLVLIFLVGCSAKPQKTKWEYKVLTIHVSYAHEASHFRTQSKTDELLTLYGQDGWELYSVTPVLQSNYGYYSRTLQNVQTDKIILIFKRPGKAKRR